MTQEAIKQAPEKDLNREYCHDLKRVSTNNKKTELSSVFLISNE